MAERNDIPLSTNIRHDSPVLVIRGDADFQNLHDCAARRLTAAKEMLFSIASVGIERAVAAEGRDLASIANAAYLLLEDADDMLLAIGHAHTREVADAREVRRG
ncbi:hypothetical protein C7446_2074 [Kushneria sinocarnis]|uniref:Uncharacterized protein n=1 Tax=Kushneria sinocarnis TaxID=595502 RepID=A0A420WWR7_9GAMM|nr:hypothetical protein [Kushneria sinocarnis]RKR03549.1 hypothetical protein C7446_2074 [Kushneria sinocarnis]